MQLKRTKLKHIALIVYILWNKKYKFLVHNIIRSIKDLPYIFFLLIVRENESNYTVRILLCIQNNRLHPDIKKHILK